MRTTMAEKLFELSKTVLLIALVASSVFLSYELWWRPSPTSSLPPALMGGEEQQMRDTLPQSIFAPSALVYHDGEESHRLIPEGEHKKSAIDLYGQVMTTLRPENLERITDEGKERQLTRRQFDQEGVTMFLPGEIPMDLWMDVMGADGDFPTAAVDRLFFYITDEPLMLNLYIYTDRGWYHTHWSVVDDLDDYEGSPPFGPELAEDEASIISRWASHIREGAGVVGESMVVIEGWQELRMSPLLSIPEVDMQVEAHTARSKFRDKDGQVMGFFSDSAGVRERSEPDGSTIYTDGYRSLQVTREDKFIYTLINPENEVEEQIEISKKTMLREAWSFLRRVMGDEVERLRLARVESHIARGTLDLDEGVPATEGYTFHFSQLFAGLPLVDDEGPISVQVDKHGVRRAVLFPLEEISELQRAPAETPISAIEECYQDVRDQVAGNDASIERVHPVYYPADIDDGDHVVRPAWYVDLGDLGWFVVDSMSGDIWRKPQ